MISAATEFFVPSGASTKANIETACRWATDYEQNIVAGVAVEAPSTQLAVELLFGTGIGTIAVADPTLPLLPQARLALAAGATEITTDLSSLSAVPGLKVYLGAHTPLTVDVAGPNRQLRLAAARCAIDLGADFLALRPDSSDDDRQSTLDLIDLVSSHPRVGVKLVGGASMSDQTLAELGVPLPILRRCLPAPVSTDPTGPAKLGDDFDQ